MDEVSSGKAMTTPATGHTATGRPDYNGLTPHVAAVEAARERLGRDLDTLNTEVRAQMGQTAEKTAWKVAATGAAIVSGVLARKLLITAWTKTRKTNPPTNPAARGTQWPEAIAWTVATSIGVGIARLVATRGAAAGWEKATGALPPGLEEVSA